MTSKADIEAMKKKRYDVLAEALIPLMEERQFEVHHVDSGEEAVKLALSLMPPKSSVSWGGSMTLDQIGLLDAVRSGPYKVIDRAEGRTPEEKQELVRKAFSVDFYLTSFNAIANDGTVVNVDGTGNRVAAITYGPSNVIAVVGMNKVCLSQATAFERAEGEAAQLNAVRFGKEDTLFTDEDITVDEIVPGRICNFIEQIAWCPVKNRIKVILVSEDLGF